MTGYFGGYALYSDDYRRSEPREARALAALQGELDRPVVVHSMFADDVERHRPARDTASPCTSAASRRCARCARS